MRQLTTFRPRRFRQAVLFAIFVSVALATTIALAGCGLIEDNTDREKESPPNKRAQSGRTIVAVTKGSPNERPPAPESESKRRGAEGNVSINKGKYQGPLGQSPGPARKNLGPSMVKPVLPDTPGPEPDLMVRDITIQNHYLTITVVNWGEANVDPTRVASPGNTGTTTIYIDDMSVPRFVYHWFTASNLDFLTVGGSTDITPLTLTKGAQVKACVDASDVVPESDEGNNCKTVDIPRSPADLKVRDIFFSNGDRTHLSFVLANVGGEDIDPASLELQLGPGPSVQGPNSPLTHLNWAWGSTHVYFETSLPTTFPNFLQNLDASDWEIWETWATTYRENVGFTYQNPFWYTTEPMLDFLVAGGSTTFTGSTFWPKTDGVQLEIEPSGPHGEFKTTVCVDIYDVVQEFYEDNNCRTEFLQAP